jgi:hypothetical protein
MAVHYTFLLLAKSPTVLSHGGEHHTIQQSLLLPSVHAKIFKTNTRNLVHEHLTSTILYFYFLLDDSS